MKFKKNKFPHKSNIKKNLLFVNIGGYYSRSMQEKQSLRLVIATNKLEAKNIAKSKLLLGCKKKHKDDIASLETLIICDDSELIKK